MSPAVRFLTVLGVAGSVLTVGAQAPKLDEVAVRVGEYVAGFETHLATVVAEETYVQTVDLPGSPGTGTNPSRPRQNAVDTYGPSDRSFPTTSRLTNKRTLRSDYALTLTDDRGKWIGYRDTFEVDGRAVRDREERLQRLLASGALAQAARIAEQNARFNLADELLTRNINVPTFALELLHPRNHERFSFKRAGAETINGQSAWVIEFRERDKPTIVRTPEGRDQPSRILAVVDPLTGTVFKTTVSWEKVTGSIVVTYGLVPRIAALVPITMSERYTTRGGVRIAGEAVYSNYRQFQTSGRVIE
jgi:hypothetical protein